MNREDKNRYEREWQKAHPEGRRKREYAYRERARQFVIDQKMTRACDGCGVWYPHYVMDFDHRDPTEKVRRERAQRG